MGIDTNEMGIFNDFFAANKWISPAAIGCNRDVPPILRCALQGIHVEVENLPCRLFFLGN